MKFPLWFGVTGVSSFSFAFITIFFGFPKVSIADPPGSVEFTSNGFSVTENMMVAHVVLIRNALSGDPFTVSFATADGTAQANVDYVPTNGVIHFATGQTNATISIRILDDSLYEGIETFSVSLSNPTAGATLGARQSTTVTIVDDESISPGRLDPQFNSQSAVNGTVFSLAEDESGGVVIGGSFTQVGGISRNGIARLNPDGSLDTAFSSGLLYGETVYAMARQPDGRIVIAGTFTSLSSVPRSRIARILANGALDPTFDPGTGADDVIRSITLQPDGKIVIGGWFSQINGTTRYRIARLTAGGALDSSFRADADGLVTCSALQADGKILVGGGFKTINGIARIYAARLNSDGSVDSSFIPAGGNSVVNGTGIKAIGVDNRGNVVVGSDSSIMYGSGRIALNRLLPNGDLDRSFSPNVPSGSWVLALSVQGDGKVIIGGNFTHLGDPTCCALHDRSGIARLNSDGSVDTSFDVGSGANPAYVTAIRLSPDSKTLIGGAFTAYNGVARGGVASLYGDARARITDWSYSNGLQFSVANQPGKTYVIESSSNMTTWTPIATNTVNSGSFQFHDTNSSAGGVRLYRLREAVTQ